MKTQQTLKVLLCSTVQPHLHKYDLHTRVIRNSNQNYNLFFSIFHQVAPFTMFGIERMRETCCVSCCSLMKPTKPTVANEAEGFAETLSLLLTLLFTVTEILKSFACHCIYNLIIFQVNCLCMIYSFLVQE